MIKIFFIGGQELVVNVASTDGIASVLADPNTVLEALYDGQRIFIPVRAIAGILQLGR